MLKFEEKIVGLFWFHNVINSQLKNIYSKLLPGQLKGSHLITRDLEGQREMINHWSVLSVLLPLETPWCCASKPHRAAPRNPCAAPRNPMVLCLETPATQRLKIPGDKFWDQNFQVSVVFRPLWPKQAIPHPITIQNMRFRQKNIFWGRIPLSIMTKVNTD